MLKRGWVTSSDNISYSPHLFSTVVVQGGLWQTCLVRNPEYQAVLTNTHNVGFESKKKSSENWRFYSRKNAVYIADLRVCVN